MPLRWELPPAERDVVTTEALLMVRRLIVLRYTTEQLTKTRENSPLTGWVVTPRLEDRLNAHRPRSLDGHQRRGPVWIRVYGVEKTAVDRVVVYTCEDTTWWRHPYESPPPGRPTQARVHVYEVSDEITWRGRGWLVDRDVEDDSRGGRYAAQCQDWAAARPSPSPSGS